MSISQPILLNLQKLIKPPIFETKMKIFLKNKEQTEILMFYFIFDFYVLGLCGAINCKTQALWLTLQGKYVF